VNRFFRSALFPLVVIVLLVYLASQTLIPHKTTTTKATFSDLITRVKTDPGSIKQVTFNPSKKQISTELNDAQDTKFNVNYPSDQSQLQFQTLLENAHPSVKFDSKGDVQGGGIYVYGGTVTVSGSTLSGNTAKYGGGGIDNQSNMGTVTVENSSTITGNTAHTGLGADVYNLGVLYLDSTSIIGILDGNPAVPI
jgi:ATP-dependent Zn protease